MSLTEEKVEAIVKRVIQEEEIRKKFAKTIAVSQQFLKIPGLDDKQYEIHRLRLKQIKDNYPFLKFSLPKESK